MTPLQPSAPGPESAPSPGRGAAPLPVDQWRRLHPLSPVIRSWKVLAAVAAVLAQERARNDHGPWFVYGSVAAAALALAAAGTFLSWLRTSWRVENGDLRIESGIVVRRSRRVPLARLQAVDIVRPLLGRLLGVAELRLEVVGRGGTEATLSYLTEEQAHVVRARLLALAHGVAEHTPAPSENVLAVVPPWRLLGSLLLSAAGGWGVIAVAYVAVMLAIKPELAAGAAVAVLPVATFAANRFAAEFGFVVADSPDGLRLRHGLLETRAQTVPGGRVQAVRIIEPLLWRPLGWARVEIDVAGYASGARGAEQRANTSALLPVAPRWEAVAMAERALRGGLPIELRDGPLTRRPGTRTPARARLLSPLSWPQVGIDLDERSTVTSRGWLRVVTDVVPHDKVQSLRWVQGPIQRRLRLATVHLDTAGRSVHAAGRHRDAAEAAALMDRISDLARERRRTSSIGTR